MIEKEMWIDDRKRKTSLIIIIIIDAQIKPCFFPGERNITYLQTIFCLLLYKNKEGVVRRIRLLFTNC